ncbi:MAG: hypothetical protein DIU78_015095 [Pseudomonadota bacterium]
MTVEHVREDSLFRGPFSLIRAASRAGRSLLGAAAALAAIAWASDGECQIRRPGAHPQYSAEIEPHLLIQHERNWWADDEGIGPGLRVTIPFMHNGPIPQINNNMGIGFGIDWAHHSDCSYRFPDGECDVNFIWIPVVVQWNFYLTPVISVFGEPGVALMYRTWDFDVGPCPINDCDRSDLDPFEPVFFAGGRFLFSDSVGMVVRLGFPYVSLGATFLL